MATQAVTSGAAVNNGGTIKKAGNANTTTGPITQSRTLLDDAFTTGYGAKVVLSSGSAGSSGNVGTASAFTNFAQPMTEGVYLMRKYTTSINGGAVTDFLTSCASDVGIRRSIPKKETARQLGSGYLTSWDYETGAITKGSNAGLTTSFGNDDAARPTADVPGELTYKTGAKLPVQDEYKPYTG